MKAWGALKGDIGDLFGVDRDYLHIPVGILLFIVFALLLRRRRWGAAGAFLGVLAIQLGNEAMDIAQSVSRGIDWAESVSDTLLTMTLPGLVLTMMLVWSRRGYRRADPFGWIGRRTVPIETSTGPSKD